MTGQSATVAQPAYGSGSSEHHRATWNGTGLKVLAACAAMIAFSPLTLNAQIVPAGAEFQVNTYTYYSQDNPAAAAAANGDFVVV